MAAAGSGYLARSHVVYIYERINLSGLSIDLAAPTVNESGAKPVAGVERVLC